MCGFVQERMNSSHMYASNRYLPSHPPSPPSGVHEFVWIIFFISFLFLYPSTSSPSLSPSHPLSLPSLRRARVRLDHLLHLLPLPLPLNLQPSRNRCCGDAEATHTLNPPPPHPSLPPSLPSGVHEFVWIISFISFLFLYPSTFNLLEIAAVEKPKLHMWATGIMRITRYVLPPLPPSLPSSFLHALGVLCPCRFRIFTLPPSFPPSLPPSQTPSNGRTRSMVRGTHALDG